MFGVLAGMGLGTTASKYVSEFRANQPERAGRIIALSSVVAWVVSLIITTASFLFAPFIANSVISSPNLVNELRLASLLILFGGINGAQTGALAGFESFKKIAHVNLLAGIANFPLLTIGVYCWGLPGAILGLIAGLVINCLLNFRALTLERRNNKIPLVFHGMFQEVAILWRFSLPVTLVSLIMTPSNWLCSVFLVNSPYGFAGVGEFTVANQWRNLIVFAPIAISSVLIPMLSSLKGDNDSKGFKRVLKLNLILTISVSFLGGGVVSLSSGVIALFYGVGFEGTSVVIILMACSGFLIAINSVVGNTITSLGQPWIGVFFCLLCGLSLVSAGYFLIPEMGAIGLALANVIAYLLHTLWQGFYIHNLLKKDRFVLE
jgi:O-antigen/teichoic acid export membrane protein